MIRDEPLGARDGVGLYLVLAFGITWCAAAVRAVLGESPLQYPLTLTMKFGPSLAGVIATALVLGRSGIVDLGRRLVRWRVGIRWYVLALVGPLAVFVVAVGVYSALGGAGIETFSFVVPESFAALGSLLLVRFFAGGGLGEELGWRGFMLPRLQDRHGALRASVIIGLWHGFWHLPAYGVAGTVVLTVFTTAMSVVATWIYNRTGGSIPVVAMMHAAFNADIEWVEILAPGLDNQFGWVLIAIVLAVGAAWKVAGELEAR